LHVFVHSFLPIIRIGRIQASRMLILKNRVMLVVTLACWSAKQPTLRIHCSTAPGAQLPLFENKQYCILLVIKLVKI
jgi:hypothetical protein